MKIGFIGLGLMGNPMAKNIHQKGFDLAVYNRSEKKLTEFNKLDVKITRSPKELAQDVDVVITMVTGPKDVEEIIFGKEGIVQAKKKNQIIIDMSTIGVQAAKRLSSRLSKKGIHFIDAPVTGSVPKAITGELTIFIGGDKQTFTKVKDVLSAMGTNLQYIGPSGSGQAVKLINNLLVASTLTSLIEGILLADELKIPRKIAAEALMDVPALSPFMKMRLPTLVSEEFKTLFSVANLNKDLQLTLQEVHKQNLPILKKVAKIFKSGVRQGYGDEDIAAVIGVIKNG